MLIGCMGEVMLELVPGDEEKATLGVAGDTYNTAVYLAQSLGAGSVDYITILGEHGFSDRIKARMERYGIGHERTLTHPDLIPGLYAIETDATGERSFTYWRSNSAARQLFSDGMVPDLNGLTHLFYSGISLAILSSGQRERLLNAIAHFRDKGGQVAFDSNFRPELWEGPEAAQKYTKLAWESCDIALPSIDDEMAIFGDKDEEAVVARLAGFGIRQGALKRGALGPRPLDGGAALVDLPTVSVVDSTAAGDSFNAGFLSAYLTGEGHGRSMRRGHELASRVVQHRGAIIF